MMNLVFAVLFRLSVNIYLRLIPFQFLSLYVIPVLFAITLRGQLRKPTESFQPAGAIAAMEREEENEKRKMEKEKLLAEEAAVEGAEGSASATAPSVASPPRDPTVIGSIVLPFLTGSRSSTSSKINLMSIVVNTLLFLFVLDAQWRPVLFMPETELQFVRVGSVDHQSCRISGRFPPVQSRSNDGSESSTATWEEEGATLKYRLAKPGSKGKWILAGVMEGSEESDWMSDLLIEGLYSSTDYEYRIFLPTSSKIYHPAFPSQLKFRTAPDPAFFSPGSRSAGSNFSFVSSSSLRPGFPYPGPLAAQTIVGAQHLSKELDRNSMLRFGIFLGSMIDSGPLFSGYGLFDSETFEKRYRQLFASPDWQSIIARLPILSTWSSTEAHPEFRPQSASLEAHYSPSHAAYQIYLGNVNPPATPVIAPLPLYGSMDVARNATERREAEEDSASARLQYYEYRYADAAFFVLDTISYRSAAPSPIVNEEPADDAAPVDWTMLGSQQLKALEEWISRVNQTITWKFVVSDAPLMSLWNRGNTWNPFAEERETVFDLLQGVPNVIVISGGQHEFAAASLRNGTITEFSTGPFNQYCSPVRSLSEKYARLDDKLLKYLPDGSSKFSVFEVDSKNPARPIVRVRVVVDGEDAWSVDVIGQPLAARQMGSKLGQLGYDLKQLLSFLVRSWFGR